MSCSTVIVMVFFFKQKTAYEMRISDWSSDVCSSDLGATAAGGAATGSSKLSFSLARGSSDGASTVVGVQAAIRIVAASRAQGNLVIANGLWCPKAPRNGDAQSADPFYVATTLRARRTDGHNIRLRL